MSNINLKTIGSLPLAEEVNENTSLVGWDGEKTVRVAKDMVGGVSSWNDIADNPFGPSVENVYTVYSNNDVKLELSKNEAANVEYYEAYFEIPEKIVVGEKYKVYFNEYEYTLTAEYNGMGAVLGSYDEYYQSGTGEYPFGIMLYDMAGMYYLYIRSNQSECHFVIFGYKKSLNPINPEFIPIPVLYKDEYGAYSCEESGERFNQYFNGGILPVFRDEESGVTLPCTHATKTNNYYIFTFGELVLRVDAEGGTYVNEYFED